MQAKGYELLIDLVEQRNFFAAHEILEEIWMTIQQSQRRVQLQGLIQLVVALHHYDRGNYNGYAILNVRGSNKLGIDISGNPDDLLVQVKNHCSILI